MLFASHPGWQTYTLTEASEAFKDDILNFDMLQKTKALKISVLEVLQLYPVTAPVSRQALQNLKVGHVEIPKGAIIFGYGR
ncbi:hypothetical protein DITRI_Ditri05aG0028200 [Diplodiscus trichospermus]